ncbi:hypothetical protein FACS1894137_19240 [Spirochaetia bacterium]|nr:hypothetical protein FACS1894137_19240 [Spirochaetia bacterium]
MAAKPGGLSNAGNNTFAGWNTGSDGGGVYYAAGDTFTMGDDDVSLYAQWAPSTPSKTFNAQSAVDGSWYTLSARKLAEGSYCIVYADETIGIRAAAAEAIVTEYETKIYTQITGAFGAIEDVDGNGKLIILLLDILDGYSGSGGYVAGYFDPTHMFATSVYPRSNKADMLYLDVSPQKPESPGFYATIAHELQHLISFSQTIKTGAVRTSEQDIWINEGLSLAAEYIYGGAQQPRIDYFNNDPFDTIKKGNNFFVWDGSLCGTKRKTQSVPQSGTLPMKRNTSGRGTSGGYFRTPF